MSRTREAGGLWQKSGISFFNSFQLVEGGELNSEQMMFSFSWQQGHAEKNSNFNYPEWKHNTARTPQKFVFFAKL
jgi:hypothetical protein